MVAGPRLAAGVGLLRGPESIKWYIKEYASFRSYDSAPRPPPFHLLSSQQEVLLSVLLCVAGRPYWRERGEEGCKRRANHKTARKRGPLWNYSILSGGALQFFPGRKLGSPPSIILVIRDKVFPQVWLQLTFASFPNKETTCYLKGLGHEIEVKYFDKNSYS